MKKRPLFFHLAKMTMVTSGILRLQKRNRWLQLLVDCANSIVPHKEFSRATALSCSCRLVVPQGGLILLRELLAKIEKYWGSEQILWQGWTGFFATLCRLNFYDPVQNFNANIANYQVGLGIEFFAIHFPWKEADRKRNLTSVSIPKTNRMNHKNRSNMIVFFIEIF